MADGKASAISLNKQNVTFAAPEGNSSYEGGVVPFHHQPKQESFKLAVKAAECFPGLRGYVGVDLVLAKDKAFVIEVNPRLTTSYIGLSKVTDFNVAQAMVNAVLNGKLPEKLQNSRYAYFSKIVTSKPTVNAFQKSAQLARLFHRPSPYKIVPMLARWLLVVDFPSKTPSHGWKKLKSSCYRILLEDNCLVEVLGFDVGGANTKAAFITVKNRQIAFG